MGKIGKKLGEEEGRGRRGEWDRRIIWRGDNIDRNGTIWIEMDRNGTIWIEMRGAADRN